ncbi:leucyl-tRNA synthetase [Candidatus Mancarchaeum acidiphilum]|uniref:Leucine--tRNA ligase n=1 Tax=Candidatus Mancarchaeum acidiphilum TaxID=1920749 RepID=A0A218NN29_9ARCH|nr:leucine--tRNA ligase [Candidatus Mancarchaeum acidiphilum]ASI13875.1 leucyl-tRNA synthetase [Candidatus Mancarchaeum acidiphilum]
MIDHNSIQSKWLSEWEKAKLFESDVNDKEGILVTAAFPYVDMPLHIGHLRTYGTADFYARYKRMRGFNVLYPMAFHKTGTPILAISKRIASNEPEIIGVLKKLGVEDAEVIKKMSDPYFLADYFEKITEEGMRHAGFSVDWRRKFDSINPFFSKMVEWQFSKLNEKKLLVTGEHPVGWCPNEGNAVGQHDTKGDVQPEISKLVAIKFKDSSSDAYFACATYRPETIYGVTNLFVNPKVQYVIADMKGTKVYMSKEAFGILKYQFDMDAVSEISGEELLARKAINPMDGKEVPVLPGSFVKPDFATGVVMSVPSHAPFDYNELEKLKDSNYDTGVKYEDYIRCLETPDESKSSETPALQYLNGKKKEDGSYDVDAATKDIYRDELRKGTMLIGDYKGKGVNEARELISKDLTSSGKAFDVSIISNEEPVYCRCGARVVVHTVKNQWFINYGEKSWKEETKSYVPEMLIYPEKTRNAFMAAVDWIDLRAAERAQGLGTKFPLDNGHIIESLSDSTIYPMFYTISNTVLSSVAKPEQLNGDFFDYVVYGKLDANEVSKSTGIDYEVLKKCRDSFSYWYKFTSRHSASDLVFNHLTMYIYNHLAVFPEEYWPKQIVVNGLVNYEGVKMSKSLGNVIPIMKGIELYGADTLRFIEIVNSDLDQVAEFNTESVNSVNQKIDYLYSAVEKLKGMGSGELKAIDFWLYSKLNRKIRDATEMVEKFNLRDAYISIFYGSINELRYYLERGGDNSIVVSDFLSKVILMLSPVMPYNAEELWHLMGNDTFVSKQQWPEPEASLIDDSVEQLEGLLNSTIEDIANTMKLTSKMDANNGKSVKSAEIIVADDWKFKAYAKLKEYKSMSKVINLPEFSATSKESLSKYLSSLIKSVNSLSDLQYGSEDEYNTLNSSKDYIKSKLNNMFEVSVKKEAESDSGRAFRASPTSPAIILEWG